jgi:UbiD family decarboxylase
MTVVSIDQKHPGHAAQALALAAQLPGGAYFSKWIIAVDADVDATDINQVIWAMSCRCNPIEDIDILRSTWSTTLDPSQGPTDKRPYGSKALINACKDHRHLNMMPVRTAVSSDVYNQVKALWSSRRLPGQPPALAVRD